MPTYEYACTKCHRRFEAVQRFSDAPLETCEVCGGQLKRVFHPVGIVLKGSGFYSTDNRSAKKSHTPSTKDGGSTETPSTSDGSTSEGSEKKKDKKKDSGKSADAAAS